MATPLSTLTSMTFDSNPLPALPPPPFSSLVDEAAPEDAADADADADEDDDDDDEPLPPLPPPSTITLDNCVVGGESSSSSPSTSQSKHPTLKTIFMFMD